MLNFSSPSKEIQLSLANDKDGRFDLITRIFVHRKIYSSTKEGFRERRISRSRVAITSHIDLLIRFSNDLFYDFYGVRIV